MRTSFPGAPSGERTTCDQRTTDHGDLRGQCVGSSYELIDPLGDGATGTVWRARDRAGGADVAVKLLRDDLMRQPKAVTRFVQERAILLMLRHRHIVRVRDLVTVGDTLGLVMDLVDGGSLRDHLREHGSLPPAQAAALLAEVASALAEAHRRGIVHRDLKPDNILLDRSGDERSGGGMETRLTDFGIARVLDEPGLTTPGALVGTPNYVAPEIVYGSRATPAADVYALGVVLYELLAGRPPHVGGTAWAILRRHVDAVPPPVPGMPDVAWRVILACMDRRPARRPSAKDLVTTLRTLARRTEGLPPLHPLPDLVEAEPAGEAVVEPVGEPSAPPCGTNAKIPPPRRAWWDAGQATTPRPVQPTARRLAMFCLMLVLAATAFSWPTWKLLDSGTQPGPTGAGAQTPHAAQPGRSATRPSVATASQAPVGGGKPEATPAPERSAVKVPAAGGSSPTEMPGFGPWVCAEGYSWDIGHPTLGRLCHSLGGKVGVLGYLQALPGIQADVTLTVVDVETGLVAGGPFRCPGLFFSDVMPEHQCGPHEMTDLPRGRRYVAVEKWRYTGRGLLPGGEVRGPVFTW